MTVLLAHRGSATQRPENTLAAFAWALEHGAAWLETDLRATADGIIVCLHDATLDRTTKGTGPVSARSFAEVAALGVPSLAEAVDAFPGVSWNVDIKAAAAAPMLARFVIEWGQPLRIRVASFQGRAIRRFRRLTRGRVPTVAAMDESIVAWGWSRVGRFPADPPYEALQLPLRRSGVSVVDRRLVAAARRAGVEVHVWTVNDVDEARRLVALGVDGIITDRIDVLGPALGSGRRPPAQDSDRTTAGDRRRNSSSSPS